MSGDLSGQDPLTVWAPTTIQQTTRDRLKELVRIGGANWHREHNPHWREGKSWMDGILCDLDEDDVLDAIADAILEHADPDRGTT